MRKFRRKASSSKGNWLRNHAPAGESFVQISSLEATHLAEFGIDRIAALPLVDGMKPIQGYHVIKPDDLHWRPSNLMRIPNADFLERTGSENLSARLWRLPPKSANTLHKHIRQEEFYFVLEGTGRMRVGEATLTVPKYGGVLVGPDQLRQVFNDTDAEVLWLIVGAPEELEFLQGSKSTGMDLKLIYPTDPTQLPKELAGVPWPPQQE